MEFQRRNSLPGLRMLGALAIMATILLAAPAAAFDPPRLGTEGPRTMILLSNASLEASTSLQAAIEAAGGRVTFAFRPSMIVAFLPETAVPIIAKQAAVLRVSREPVAASSLGRLSRDQEGALAVWNGYFMGLGNVEGDGLPPGVQAPGRGYACGVPVPEEYCAAPLDKKGYGAGDLSTSEYMLLDGDGSMHRYFHVKFVFPESDGSIDPSTENWTFEMMQGFIVECVEGIEWWFARDTSARMALVVSTTWQVNTPYEPITRASTFEGTWIDGIMTALGYGGASYFYKVRNFDNDYLTGAEETWFNTIFVVNSLNDPDGRFTDNKFDYSYFGGPFMVMTYDNGPWGNDDTDYLCAHETGHTFYAQDEYDDSGCTDTQTAGYLNAPNGNCENGGGSSVECIMRNNSRLEFTNGSVCSFTRDQIGWRDTDADGIPNILEHRPDWELTSVLKDTTCSLTLHVTGRTWPLTEDNLNPLTYTPSGSSAKEEISVNSIERIEYRLNAEPWQSATPTDGAWDEGEEYFEFTTGSLSPLVANSIQVLITNSRELQSSFTKTVTYGPCLSWCEDCDDADASDWSIVNSGASIALDNTVSQSGAWSMKVTGASGSGQWAQATSPEIRIDFAKPYSIRFWYRWSSFHWDQWLVCGHVRLLIDQTYNPIRYDPVGDWSSLPTLGVTFSAYIPQNTWKLVEIAVTPASRQYTVTIDGNLLGTASYSPSVVPSSTLWFMDNPSSTNYMNAWYDGFCVEGFRVASGSPGNEEAASLPRRAVAGRPNPFDRTTTIDIQITEDGPATLSIFDVAGRKVRTLVHGGPIRHEHTAFAWDGKDDAGRHLPAGAYFARLRTNSGSAISKLVLIE